MTTQYFIIHSDYQKTYSPLEEFVILFPPYHISAKLYSPLYQICFFSVPPSKFTPPPHIHTHTHTEKMIGPKYTTDIGVIAKNTEDYISFSVKAEVDRYVEKVRK